MVQNSFDMSTMWQCSQCKQPYKMEFEAGDNIHFCPDCLKKQQLPPLTADFFATPKVKISPFWTLGFLAGLLLLAGQIYWVEHEKVLQNPEQRVWLEKFCQTLHCVLPAYHNRDEFEILLGDLQLNGNSHYLFQTVISNQASFAQDYPRIKLVLLSFNGQVFAERVFYPNEYLDNPPDSRLGASETIEVNLKIAIPPQKVGGYTFELI
jgi:hypothetical protein